MTRRPDRKRAAPKAPKSSFALNGSPEVGPRATQVFTIAAWVLAGLLAIALVYMISGPHKVGDNFTETDFYGAYAQGARLIEHGHLVPSRYAVIGPVYEITLGLIGFVIHDLFLAAELLSLVTTLAVLMLWFYLLRARLNARTAFFACLFMATNAYFFQHGCGAMTDAFAIALQAIALLLLLTRASDRAIGVAGIAAGVAFLTRYNAVYLLPTGIVAVFAGGTLAPHRRRAAVLFSAGFFVPVLPWVLFSISQGSHFEFQLHHNIAYDVFARAKGIPWDDYQRDLQPQFKTLWDVIARDPKAVASRMVFNVWDHLRQDALTLLTWPVAAAAAVGLIFAIRDGSARRIGPLLFGGVLLFGTLVPVFYSQRYSLALLPLYATLAAIAFTSPLLALVAGRRRPVWLKPALAVVPLVIATRATIAHEAHVIDQLPSEVLQCAETLEQLKKPGDRIIARKWHIAYHAGVEPLAFPFVETLPQLAAYAKENHARWLYFSWPEAETRPRFYYLLDTTAVVPGLTVHRVTRPHPAVLYEIGPRFGEIPDWFANDTLAAWHDSFARLHIDEDPKQLYRFGGLSWMLGRLVYARNALTRTIELDPRNVDAMLMLGNVLILQNDAAAARTVYQRAEALSPGNPSARYGLGWANVLTGNQQEAARLWRPIISTTTSPAALQRMASLYHMLGDREGENEAIGALERLRGAP
jgi:tetratricopeptide (TPR) repeat protein